MLIIGLILTSLSAMWCGAGYRLLPAQQVETRSELQKSQASHEPITDDEIAVHVSRLGQQGRNWCFAFLLSGLGALVTLVALMIQGRKWKEPSP